MKKTGCIICGKDLVYFDDNINKSCYFCKNEFSTNVTCVDNHYICDNCHSLDANNIIETYCSNSNSQNAMAMAVELMHHKAIKMHGPEHHYLVPAVLLTAYYNHINQYDKIIEKI